MPTKKTLNEKIATLDQQIDWFYGDEFTLTDASAKYKQARELAEEIEKDLEGLKNDIEIIDRNFTE